MSLTYDTSSVNYDCNMFIIQATGLQISLIEILYLPGAVLTIIYFLCNLQMDQQVRLFLPGRPFKGATTFIITIFIITTLSRMALSRTQQNDISITIKNATFST